MSESSTVDIQGKHLKLTNLEKVLYPAAGFTKGQVIDYYARIAPVLVPHLAGRPLTLKRYPNGVDQQFFFEKNATIHRPPWVKTAPIWSEGNNRNVNYILANDLPTLVWVANLAAIELHPSLSLAKKIESPTMLVFDLDPGAPANMVQCAQVGISLRARERPTVSTPVKWEEVEQVLKKKDPSLVVFEANQVLDRAEKLGDLFEPLLKLKQKLPSLPGVGKGAPEAIAAGLELAAQAEPRTRKKTAIAATRPAASKKRRKV